MSKKYEKLKGLLKELFQLDQPDLDFGLYRIMHAKSAEITQFLDTDLLPQVKAEFERHESVETTELKKKLDKRIKMRQELGDDPDKDDEVQRLRAEIAGSGSSPDQLESEVYDHLFGFFRRYYSDGDFLSKRVYKPGVYAIPYEGEEVKLHWANADQYYIKTSEYLRDYAFRLRPDDDEKPMRVHFRLADVAEGEHGNVKAAEGKDRVFILAPAYDPSEQPESENEDSDTGEENAKHNFIEEEPGEAGEELVLRFEYRQTTLNDWPESDRKGKKKPPTQKDLLEVTESRVTAFFSEDGTLKTENWFAQLTAAHTKANGEKTDYSRLRAHLNRYVARNTFDYFIHKDLGGFLGREMDFYIKNEVMHLDDIENETVPRVEQYLSKIKVIRRVAGKIIAFLAQLENYQKKLWEKKKLVIETGYMISLDKIPKELRKDAFANVLQVAEWEKLFRISVDGEKAEPKGRGLTIDTRHFSASWTARLLDTITDIEKEVTGILVHSENSQAMSLIGNRFQAQIQSAYLDPPYNTDAGPISYKNGYRRSTWASMIHDRLQLCKQLMSNTGVVCATIDDYQFRELSYLIEAVFGSDNFGGVVSIRSNPSGRPIPSGLSQSHEYAIFAGASKDARIEKLPRTDAQAQRYRESDEDGAYMWELFRKRGSGSERADRQTLYYPVYAKDGRPRVPEMTWHEGNRVWTVLEEPQSDEVVVWPIDKNGVERRWRGTWQRINDKPSDFKVGLSAQNEPVLYYKFRPSSDGVVATTSWIDSKYSATEHGTGTLRDMFTEYHLFDFPKSVFAVEDCIRLCGLGAITADDWCLDCFGGSGTTGHAVLNLNRADGGNRRFVLVEAETYFDTALMPRLRKAAFSSVWAAGSPEANDKHGLPVFWKYIRLESYEDALNNLEIKQSDQQTSLIEANDDLREQYMLRYMLDVETAGSPSLLNVGSFTDPTAYKLKVKRPGSDETRETNVDLIETFNWLIGLTVNHLAAPQCFEAKFERDSEKRMTLKGRLKSKDDAPHWFRTVTGTTPDGRKTLVIWRKRPGGEDPEGVEQDNLVLDEWFTKQGYSSKDSEFDLIYVNGTNNLENLRTATDTWKVRLIEEDFHRLMFEDTE